MPEPARDHKEGPATVSKAAAAMYLAKSVRTVEQYIASGKLPVHYVSGPHGRQATFRVDDLARLKTELETPLVRAIAPPSGRAPNGTETLYSGSVGAPPGAELSRIEPAAALAELFAAARALADAKQVPVLKLWLNLKEASELSGLPESWLRDFANRTLGRDPVHVACADALPKIDVLDVGKRPGGRYRFRRDSL